MRAVLWVFLVTCVGAGVSVSLKVRDCPDGQERMGLAWMQWFLGAGCVLAAYLLLREEDD